MPPPDPPADHPRRLLAELGLSPGRRRGQNFLHDKNIARKIVAAARKMGPPFLAIGGAPVADTLPSSLSSPIVLRLMDLREVSPGAVPMLQKEVVERLWSIPGGK